MSGVTNTRISKEWLDSLKTENKASVKYYCVDEQIHVVPPMTSVCACGVLTLPGDFLR